MRHGGTKASASRRVQLGPVATSISATVLAVLPVYLVGALGSELRTEMGFGATALGVAVGAFFTMSAAVSMLCGRYAERRDPWNVMRISALVAVCSLVGIAALSGSWVHLAGWLLLAGLANALVQPTTNRIVAQFVDRARHGLALGAKQGAVPAASLVAGLGVSMLAHPLGWRALFVVAAVLGVALIVVIPTRSDPVTAGKSFGDETGRLPALVRTAVAAGLGAAAANSVPVFVTGTAVAEGVDRGVAGLLLSFGSTASIVARVVVGRWADRSDVNRFGLLAVVMAVGAGGLGLLSLASASGVALGTTILMVGIAIAFGAGWGWQGLLQLAIVTRYPSSPSRATGVVSSGVYAGAIVGPILLGALIDNAGYATAWAAGAVTLATAAAVMWFARHVARPPDTSSATPDACSRAHIM